MDKRLTNKQQAFVNEYLKDFNATGAAERAGYKGSRNSLAVIGSQNLRKLKIRQCVDDYMEEQAMSWVEVLYRLSRQARGSMEMFLSRDEDGRLWFDLEKAEAHGALDLIQGIKFVEKVSVNGKVERRVELKLYDAQRALNLIARGMGMFVDRMEVKGVEEDVQGIEALNERVFTFREVQEAFEDVRKWEEERFGRIDE